MNVSSRTRNGNHRATTIQLIRKPYTTTKNVVIAFTLFSIAIGYTRNFGEYSTWILAIEKDIIYHRLNSKKSIITESTIRSRPALSMATNQIAISSNARLRQKHSHRHRASILPFAIRLYSLSYFSPTACVVNASYLDRLYGLF